MMMSSDSIYGGVPQNVREQLRQGLGSQLSTAFTPDQLREVDLREEGAWDELSEIIEALVRSMR